MNEINDQRVIRLKKMKKLLDNSINPFGNKFKCNFDIKTLYLKFNKYSKNELLDINKKINIFGRIISKSIFGKAGFIYIKDFSGKIQIYFRKDLIKTYKYNIFLELDLGDFIGITGKIFKTNTGELTLKVFDFVFLSKALRILPSKYYGLNNIEQKYRKRYLDLIVNKNSINIFIIRSKIINYIRKFFDKNKFMEVETSMLYNKSGGAIAKPFIVYHNALSKKLYLRIALEIQLKKLIIGGIEKVYEIGRVFRNEGIDSSHNPEFTMLEAYIVNKDYIDIMNIIEKLFKYLSINILINNKIYCKNILIDFESKFKKIHMVDIIKEKIGINFWKKISLNEGILLAKKYNVKIEKNFTLGHIINAFFEQYIEKKIIEPTFIFGHPIEISPLAKKNIKDSRFTDRFELFINGKEIVNAFSELNDPIEQLERFKNQNIDKKNKFSNIDLEFIEALEYGMPPTGGFGIGIDRLVMLFTNSKSIKDVLFFPTMK